MSDETPELICFDEASELTPEAFAIASRSMCDKGNANPDRVTDMERDWALASAHARAKQIDALTGIIAELRKDAHEEYVARVALRKDAARLDWLESVLRPGAPVPVEVFFAGLRQPSGEGFGDATAFQCEVTQSPWAGATVHAGPTLRQAIDAARKV